MSLPMRERGLNLSDTSSIQLNLFSEMGVPNQRLKSEIPVEDLQMVNMRKNSLQKRRSVIFLQVFMTEWK